MPGQIIQAQTTVIPITIEPEIRHQEMTGFGAALSWNINSIYSGTAQKAAALEAAMFEDLGLDILRLKNWYYPDDDDRVSAMRDHHNNARLFHAAKAANPDIEVLYSSWSPPAHLKSNGERRNGGTLKKDANGNYMYQAFADYWVEVLDNLGWTPDYLSFQNEPGWVATWETCVFAPNQTTSSAGYAQAADAIWNAIKDRPDVPKMVGSEAENMPAFFSLNQPLLSRPYFAVHGYHVYDIGNASQIDSSTTINRLRRIRDDFGDRPNWQTEFSREFNWIDAARVIHNTLVEANASAYVYWMLFWRSPRPESMIENIDNNSFQINPPYYTMKHYAKHVHKGYQRIEVGGSNSNVRVSGYISPLENSITLVTINRGTTAETITLEHDNLPIEEIEGYQSVMGNFYQPMAGLGAANPITLPASSMTTLVLSLTDAPSIALFDGDIPVAVDDTSVLAASLNSPVSRTFTVSNLGTDDLLLTGSPDAVVFSETGSTSHNGFTISSNIPAGSTTLEPGQSADFTVTFQTATPGTFSATVSIPNNDPTKDPYTFAVTASTLTYTITYNGNNNTSGTAPSPQTKQHGLPLVLSENTGNLQKTGFFFAGWNTAADGSGIDHAAGGTYTGNADLTLYAKWGNNQVLSAQSGAWNLGTTWNDGLAARAGFDYVARSNHVISTPDGTDTQIFPGESLTLGDATTQGRLQLTRGSTIGPRTTQFKNLTILDGRLQTNNWATLHTVRTDSGNIPIDRALTLIADSSDSQQRTAGLIIDASLSGTGVNIIAQAQAGRTWNRVQLDRANTVSGTIRSALEVQLIVNHANALQNLTLNSQSGDTGSITFNQNSMLGGLAGSENIDLGGRAISVGNNHTDTTYSGQISNGSLTKVGTGTLTLSGENAHTGATIIADGSLRVNGSLAAGSAVTVNDAATLAGNGTIGGSLTIADGGIFQADGGSLAVGGAVTLSPGSYLVAGDIEPVGTDPIILMTYGSLSGSFGSVDLPVGWAVDYAFGGNSIALVRDMSGTFTVTYEGNQNSGGTAPSDSNSPYAAGTEVFVLGAGDLVKTGHAFSHWNTAANGTGESLEPNDTFDITGDITLHAQWNASPLVSAGPDQTVSDVSFVSWTPAQIPTAAWYDAADAGTLTSDGVAVSQWRDKSGNGNHAAQANAAVRPTIGTFTIGGKNTVSFRVGDGTNRQFLTAPNHASLNLDGSGGLNLFSVMRSVDFQSQGGGTLNAPMAKGQVLDASIGYGMRTATNSVRFKAGGAASISATVNDGATLIFSGVRRDAEDRAEFYTDGLFRGSRTDANLKSSNNTDPLHIGRDNSSGRYSNIDFGEILILGGALTTAERQQIEGYLAHKWGMAGQLPAAHPHKSAVPGFEAAVVTLNGSATDPENDTITYLWTVSEGPAAVTFADPTHPQTTAILTVPGTYTLRLTANDGLSSAHDEIVVTFGLLTPYETWAAANNLTGDDADPTADPDGDGLPNLLEFAFGTDPLSGRTGPILFVNGGEVTRPGTPTIMDFKGNQQAPPFRAVFARRKNHAAAGLTYIVEFSVDLEYWDEYQGEPAVLSGEENDGDIEAVGVPFPASVPTAHHGNQAPRFFRIGVSMN